MKIIIIWNINVGWIYPQTPALPVSAPALLLFCVARRIDQLYGVLSEGAYLVEMLYVYMWNVYMYMYVCVRVCVPIKYAHTRICIYTYAWPIIFEHMYVYMQVDIHTLVVFEKKFLEQWLSTFLRL